LAEEETGRPYPLGDLAALCEVAPAGLREGALDRLDRAGYVAQEPSGEPGGGTVMVSPTLEGRLALQRHLSALQALPRSLQERMLGKRRRP
jgi:DNA-binding MarR family transcriptional regulator